MKGYVSEEKMERGGRLRGGADERCRWEKGGRREDREDGRG